MGDYNVGTTEKLKLLSLCCTDFIGSVSHNMSDLTS